jgi:hypothetical protein
MVAHLVAKSIEHDVIFPKIVSIIHKVGYEDASEQLQSREDRGEKEET